MNKILTKQKNMEQPKMGNLGNWLDPSCNKFLRTTEPDWEKQSNKKTK